MSTIHETAEAERAKEPTDAARRAVFESSCAEAARAMDAAPFDPLRQWYAPDEIINLRLTEAEFFARRRQLAAEMNKKLERKQARLAALLEAARLRGELIVAHQERNTAQNALIAAIDSRKWLPIEQAPRDSNVRLELWIPARSGWYQAHAEYGYRSGERADAWVRYNDMEFHSVPTHYRMPSTGPA